LKNEGSKPYIVTRVLNCKVRLIDTSDVVEPNKYYEEISMSEAANIASAAHMDLVCFGKASDGKLPFYKVINFGKWKYEVSKKKKKQQKECKKTSKEIRLSVDIAEHDLAHKIKQANKFLDEGHDVLFTMRLKGRQRAHATTAKEKMVAMANMCEEVKIVSKKPDGNSYFSIRVIKGKEEK